MASPHAPRMAVVGMSVSPTCGVRAHAGVLANTLADMRVTSSLLWLSRSEDSLRTAHAQVRAWTRELGAELGSGEFDAVLLHYSVFAYSYRGVPFFSAPTMSALRSSRLPVIAVLHELAYPWTRAGARGKVWALTQRAALVDVVRTSTALLATDESRVRWLATRRWLARRPVELAPVFSNLPPPTPGRGPDGGRGPAGGRGPDGARKVVGLFGYSYAGAAVSLVLDALRLLADRGVEVEVRLLGAPGRVSAAGEEWSAQAQARGVAHALSFSGALPAQELSDALAECDVLLSADTGGPSSRKGTLAASLASARPVIALDGPSSWPELTRFDAARVVEPRSDALADAVGALLADERQRNELGGRGRSFAERQIGPERTAEAVHRLLADAGVRVP